jgi:hypothetical protein
MRTRHVLNGICADGSGRNWTGMGRVDWDALKAAAAEAAVLMIVLTSASLLYIFSLVMAALVGPWLSLVAFVTIFILLTAVMYKYESSVNEEDN